MQRAGLPRAPSSLAQARRTCQAAPELASAVAVALQRPWRTGTAERGASGPTRAVRATAGRDATIAPLPPGNLPGEA